MKQIIAENGIRFIQIPAKQFKTLSIRVNLYRPLCKEEATKNALITRLLKSGTVEHPTPLALNRALDELYGATLSSGIVKRGETASLSFGIQVIKDTFTGEWGTQTKAIQLLCDVISNPVTENNGFSKEFFERERENLKMKIENRVNDKKTYAFERCYEEMCKDEAFGVYEHGRIADLEQLDPVSLYQHYQKIIQSPMDVFVCGDVSLEEIIPLFSQFSPSGTIPSTHVIKDVKEVKRINDEMDVNQGKLSMGFRTGIDADSPLFPALMLYNSILGSGVHSKLFRNVREKLSLCYYAYSRLERFKGTMMISSGIEFDKFKDAYDEILLQTEEMKQGNISDEELSSALSSLTNQLTAMADTQGALLDYAMIQAMMKTPSDSEEMIQTLSAVTKEQIIQVAQGVTLDTVYFLKNKGGKEA